MIDFLQKYVASLLRWDRVQSSVFLPEYGSMLSSPSSESHVRSSFANRANRRNYKCETDETGTGNMTENVVFAARDAVLDADMHWEMNYHEAAIFLQVNVYISNNDSVQLTLWRDVYR